MVRAPGQNIMSTVLTGTTTEKRPAWGEVLSPPGGVHSLPRRISSPAASPTLVAALAALLPRSSGCTALIRHTFGCSDSSGQQRSTMAVITESAQSLLRNLQRAAAGPDCAQEEHAHEWHAQVSQLLDQACGWLSSVRSGQTRPYPLLIRALAPLAPACACPQRVLALLLDLLLQFHGYAAPMVAWEEVYSSVLDTALAFARTTPLPEAVAVTACRWLTCAPPATALATDATAASASGEGEEAASSAPPGLLAAARCVSLVLGAVPTRSLFLAGVRCGSETTHTAAQFGTAVHLVRAPCPASPVRAASHALRANSCVPTRCAQRLALPCSACWRAASWRAAWTAWRPRLLKPRWRVLWRL